MPRYRQELAAQEGLLRVQRQQMQKLQEEELAASMSEKSALLEEVAAMQRQLKAAQLQARQAQVGAGGGTGGGLATV